MLLIVNVDDLGGCVHTTDAVLELVALSVCRSASVLTNGACAAEAVDAVRQRGADVGVDIGVHLNATEGRPMLPVDQVPSLVRTGSDCFWGKHGFSEQLASGHIDLHQLKAEFAAQIAWTVRQLQGQPPGHLDGHNHIHVLPEVSSIVAELAAEFAVPSVRVPHQQGAEERQLNPYLQRMQVCAAAAREVFVQAGLCVTDAFLGLTAMGSHLTALSISDALSRLGPEVGSCELMVHPSGMHAPGHERCACRARWEAGQSPDDFYLSPDRAHELSVLSSPDFRAVLAAHACVVGTFADLQRP